MEHALHGWSLSHEGHRHALTEVSRVNPRADRSQIPEAVAESVDRFVDSLDGLEILVFLARNAERAWTPAEIAVTLGIVLRRAQRSLEHLLRVAICVVETRPDNESAYRYAPSGADVLEAAERIVAAYRTRRVALINYVASEALNRIRALGEAFRVRTGNSDE